MNRRQFLSLSVAVAASTALAPLLPLAPKPSPFTAAWIAELEAIQREINASYVRWARAFFSEGFPQHSGYAMSILCNNARVQFGDLKTDGSRSMNQKSRGGE